MHNTIVIPIPPTPEEARVLALADALTRDDTQGRIFTLYVDETEDGPVYGIGFTQGGASYAPRYYFPTAAEIAAAMIG